ncbi:MAG: taurine dioxygenase [Parasphingorhabdus sp.]|jgi:taurine dioxygenase
MNIDPVITRLAGTIGAEITGINLGQLSSANQKTVTSLLHQHLVLFFPDQHLNTDQHVALGKQFGVLDAHPNLSNPFSTHAEIFELAATHGGIADEWHSDISFKQHPSIMSILNMIECPEYGGDTLWANTQAAYDALSAPLKELCDGLTALHDASPHGQPEICMVHPVVRLHPETGRKGLFVNQHFTRRIVEMSHEESEMLLGYLIRWISTPRFTVRYHWKKGTIAMWDNRCTQHFVLSDFDEQRIIQRVTVMGDTPANDNAPRWQPFIRSEGGGATSRYDNQLNDYLGNKVISLQSNRRGK